ncbi:MAG TPA: type II toxin-antitoxin system death-on-curing family toxin [Candidatus Saccharimonadales bacterium]|nr:type II toxin-antitoxin system death-on-curing family toxin [Candidatus Saccharimonadales bacterium]
MAKFPTLEEIVAMHFRITEKTGGSQGVRDLGLLDSALGRPQASFGGEELYPTIFLKAAALVQSLSANHPFVDGNKRTALATLEYFLHLNGYEIEATQKEKVEFTLWSENEKPSIEEIADWIKKHIS